VNNLLEKVREINKLQRETFLGEFSFDELAKELSSLLDANIYIISSNGKILGDYYTVKKDTIVSIDKDEKKISNETNDEMSQFKDAQINITGKKANFIFKENKKEKKYHAFFPIIIDKEKRVGTIIFSRYYPKFSEEDIILGELSSMIVGFEIKRVSSEKKEKEERAYIQAKKAVGTLSFSEIRAVKAILKELENKKNNNIIIATDIARRGNITRSVIVTAIKKFESADIIYSKSLGMKGTYVKILNNHIFDAIEEINL
jgi:transcriptional pleiotropic repressor